MNCDMVKPILSSYIDGEVCPRDGALIQAHLADCASCRRELEALKSTSCVLSAVSEMEPPAFLMDQIMAATVARPAARISVREAFGWVVRMPKYAHLAAASIVAVLALISISIHAPHAQFSNNVLPVQKTPSVATSVVSGTVPLKIAVTETKVASVDRTVEPRRLHRHSASSRSNVRRIASVSVGNVVARSNEKTSVDRFKYKSVVPVAAPAVEEKPATAIADVQTLPTERKSLSSATSREMRLAQESGISEQIRAQIAARNRERNYASYGERPGSSRCSISIASIRF